MKVILDTNVLVIRAEIEPRGIIRNCISTALASISNCLNHTFIHGDQDALTRPENMTGASTEEEILGFLRYLCRIAHRQEVFF